MANGFYEEQAALTILMEILSNAIEGSPQNLKLKLGEAISETQKDMM